MSILQSVAGGLLDKGLDWVTGSESMRESRRAQQSWDRRAIQTRVADAKKAGIHPLAALGIPMSSGPSFSMSGSPSNVFQSAFSRDSKPDPYMAYLARERQYYETDILASQAQSAAAEAQVAKHRASVEVGKGPAGSRTNPKRGLIWYEIERPDGSTITIPAPASELAEGGEGAIGSKLFYGTNVDWKTYRQLFPSEPSGSVPWYEKFLK